VLGIIYIIKLLNRMVNCINFEILEHTADLRLKAKGKTLEELFKNALKGIAYILCENSPDITEFNIKKRPFKIVSQDVTTLLIDFLNEAVYLSNVNKEVYKDVIFTSFSENHCEGEFIGVKVEKFDEDIKAVTYHEAEILKELNGYTVTIVLDI
jgi:SHS2 domain-containing protein